MKKIVLKEPVRLRQRERKNGIKALYLDINHNGQRSYEYLKLYIHPGQTKEVKEANRRVMEIAQAMRAKRVLEIQRGEFGEKKGKDILLIDYYMKLADSRKGATKVCWHAAGRTLREYIGNTQVMLADVTSAWVNGYRDYLIDAVSAKHKAADGNPVKIGRNSAFLYFSKFKACLHKAMKDEYLSADPTLLADPIPKIEPKRNHLTMEEVGRLNLTECRRPNVKRAFLFSCLTGLRYSDVSKLCWGDVFDSGGFTRLVFRQKKTGGQEYLDISEHAASILGEAGKSEDKVFPGFSEITPRMLSHTLAAWVKAAGIDKKITFHCARHTFAIMMLELGTDLYTVSKLLGHREISTTQIYAKVLDNKRREAVSRIPNLLAGGK